VDKSDKEECKEQDEEQEEENDEELEVVDARMFRPIVEPPQSSADQGEDYDTEEVPAAELVDDQPGGDAAGKGTVLAVDVDVGLCDGPGEVSDEGATPPEDFEMVEMGDVAEVPEASAEASAAEFQLESSDQVPVPADTTEEEQLIDFDEDENNELEARDVVGPLAPSEQLQGPSADDDDVDLPLPPPPLPPDELQDDH